MSYKLSYFVNIYKTLKRQMEQDKVSIIRINISIKITNTIVLLKSLRKSKRRKKEILLRNLIETR